MLNLYPDNLANVTICLVHKKIKRMGANERKINVLALPAKEN